MSIAVTVTTRVVCDRCGRQTDGYSSVTVRAREARKRARANRWRKRQGGPDLCPPCDDATKHLPTAALRHLTPPGGRP